MTSPVDPLIEARERREAQKVEYGTWAAGRQIFVGESLAYDVGHPIPASNVSDDGSVVVLRHYCPPDLPGQPKCEIENNLVIERTEPGVAIKVNLHLRDSDSKATTTTKAAPKTKES